MSIMSIVNEMFFQMYTVPDWLQIEPESLLLLVDQLQTVITVRALMLRSERWRLSRSADSEEEKLYISRKNNMFL